MSSQFVEERIEAVCPFFLAVGALAFRLDRCLRELEANGELGRAGVLLAGVAPGGVRERSECDQAAHCGDEGCGERVDDADQAQLHGYDARSTAEPTHITMNAISVRRMDLRSAAIIGATSPGPSRRNTRRR